MATFAPEVQPTYTPNYLRLSQPISQPQGDMTIGTVLKGFGDTIETALKGANQVVEGNIQDQLYKAIDPVRDQFTQGLDLIKGVVSGQPANDPANPNTLVSQEIGNQLPPDQLQGLASQVSNLQSAAQNGKISPTYYTGQLNAIAKNMRSQYPGWRPFIDQTVAQITGGNPANQYIQQMLTTINNSITQTRTNREKNLSFIRDNLGQLPTSGPITGASLYAGVENGTVSGAQAMAVMSRYLAPKAAMQNAVLAHSAGQASRDETADQLMPFAQNFIHDTVNNYMQDHMQELGIPSQDQLQQLLSKSAAGGVPGFGPEQWNAIGNKLTAATPAMMQYVRQQFYDTKTTNGQTYADILGPDRMNKLLTESDGIKNWNALIQAIYGGEKNVGMISYLTNAVSARGSQNAYSLLNDKGTGYVINMLQGLQKTASPQFMQNLSIPSLYGGGFPSAVTNYINTRRNMIYTQPDVSQGKINTLLGISQDFKSKADSLQIPAQMQTGVNKAILGSVDKLNPALVQTDPQIAVNISKGAYSPGNLGYIESLNPDAKDSNGNTIQGQIGTFNNMISRDKTDAEYMLDKSSPGTWNQYQNWATLTGRNVFQSQIAQLNSVGQWPQGVSVSWNTNTHQWQLQAKQAPFARQGGGTRLPTLDVTQTPEYSNIQDAVNKLNSVMPNLNYMAQKSGQDADMFALKWLMDSGFDPRQPNVSIPSQLAQALYNAHKK